ncbi:MAG: hypothetical protein ACOCQ3_02095 [Natronomonas sp.]
MTDREDAKPPKGKQYRYADGTVEVVFATEDERVLTVREYSTLDAFERRIAEASDEGIHPEVAALPGVEGFLESETNADFADDTDGVANGEDAAPVDEDE